MGKEFRQAKHTLQHCLKSPGPQKYGHDKLPSELRPNLRRQIWPRSTSKSPPGILWDLSAP